jgi:hypothetical protein
MLSADCPEPPDDGEDIALQFSQFCRIVEG